MPIVLMVEDNETLVRAYERLFVSAHYELVFAQTIQEARQTVFQYQERIRVILIDQNLPDGKGENFAVEVEKNSPDTHIILVTGEPLKSPFEVIEKPFSLQVLQARLLELTLSSAP